VSQPHEAQGSHQPFGVDWVESKTLNLFRILRKILVELSVELQFYEFEGHLLEPVEGACQEVPSEGEDERLEVGVLVAIFFVLSEKVVPLLLPVLLQVVEPRIDLLRVF
jgi:hypothetical protein